MSHPEAPKAAPKATTIDLLTSIPGRTEFRIIHGVSMELSFENVMCKLCMLWGINVKDFQHCAVSYHNNTLAKNIVIDTQDEWKHACENNFYRLTQRPLGLELFKRTVPSEAE